MRFELFVAKRYLFAQRGVRFISITTWIAVAGVGIGVAALIIMMGIMNGFATDLRDKIIGVTAHAIVYNTVGPVKESTELLESIRSTPGVKGATPFIHAELMLSSRSGSKGIFLRGIDPDTAPKVLTVLQKMTEGSVSDLKNSDPIPGIIVGKKLAEVLHLIPGSRVNILAPAAQQNSAGYAPKVTAFRVVGIFSLGMEPYDSSAAFVSLDGIRNTLGWPEDVLTGIEVAVDDIFKADNVADAVIAKLGPSYYQQSWMSSHANIFAALKLEKTAMTIIMSLIVMVGAFSIITALVMVVMEKTKDIAVLMSIGATKQQIRRIFIGQGVLIGAMGTILGYATGLGICFALKRYKFIDLPEGVYTLDYLPVLLQWPELVLTGVCAIGICFLATLYPASTAANLEPVEALRQE